MRYYKSAWHQTTLAKYYDKLLDRIEHKQDTRDQAMFAGPTAVGDFNGDGHKDIIYFISADNNNTDVTNGPTFGQMIYLQGTGKGRFVDKTSTLQGNGELDACVRKVRVGDFNGDGIDDLVLATNREDGRSGPPEVKSADQIAFLSSHNGLKEIDLDFRQWGHSLAVGDVNNDGLQDWLVGGFIYRPDGANTALFIQKDDGGFEKIEVPGLGGLASAIGDFDGDGVNELIDYRTLFNDQGRPEATGFQTYTWNGADLSEETFVESEGFVRTEQYRTWTDELQWGVVSQDPKGNKYLDQGLHDLAVGDVNGDGRDDIVGVRFAGTLEYVDGYLDENKSKALTRFEVFSENEQGVIEQLDVKMTGWDVPLYGILQFDLVDWNGDGHLDIFVPLAEEPPGNHPKFTGAVVMINDGSGNFKRLDQNMLPDFRHGPWMKGNAIDANGDGIMDIIYGIDGARGDDQTSWQGQDNILYLGTTRLNTGPGYSNPALKGAAGFNEAFYLNAYADAAQAVKSGKFSSGLEHFLKVGRDEGYFGFAENTIVYGSKKADIITLREGDEKAFGLGGNDTLIGGDGDDWLDGGKGDDVLTGGAGADTFVYSGGNDVVTDFNAAEGDIMIGNWPA